MAQPSNQAAFVLGRGDADVHTGKASQRDVITNFNRKPGIFLIKLFLCLSFTISEEKFLVAVLSLIP